jgi:hypothetical protein
MGSTIAAAFFGYAIAVGFFLGLLRVMKSFEHDADVALGKGK